MCNTPRFLSRGQSQTTCTWTEAPFRQTQQVQRCRWYAMLTNARIPKLAKPLKVGMNTLRCRVLGSIHIYTHRGSDSGPLKI